MISRSPSYRLAARAAVVTITTALATATLAAPASAAGYGVDGVAPDTRTGETSAPTAPAASGDVKITSTDVPAIAPKKVDDAAEHEGHDHSDDASVVAELPQESTSSYRMVGVTWAADSDLEGVTAEVRTRTDGTWSEWQELHVEGGDEPGVPGTEPLWVGEADGVAARVFAESGTPTDVKVDTIDPGAGPTEGADAASTTGASHGVASATTVADAAPSAVVPVPSIITRATWGAAASNKCDTPLVGATSRGAVIHHTAGSNSYTGADSWSLVKGVQAYHMKSRKWCDIGYNFLVDKFGRIFEGRAGGVDRNVRAAHSGNSSVNNEAMGVSLMGNFETAQPTAAMKDAVVQLVGWRLASFYLPAKGTYKLGGKTLNMIAGHRDVVGTACPGKNVYAWLSASGGLRDRVATYISKADSGIKRRYAKEKSSLGLPFVGETALTGGRYTVFANMDLYESSAGTFGTNVGWRTTYRALGATKSPLGFPIQDSPAVSATDVVSQSFANGALYSVPKFGGYSIYGETYKLYVKLNQKNGPLGAPRSSVGAVTSGVSRTNFASGYILFNTSTNKATAYSSNGTVLDSSTSGGSTTPPSSSSALARVGTPVASSTTTSATFYWNNVAGATQYDVCLQPSGTSTSCTKASTVAARSGSFSSQAFKSLKPTGGTDWYAKVRARNGSKVGAWSALRGVDLKKAATTNASSTVTVPSSRTVTFTGHGYGHGIGMSQYGAEGAARSGVKYPQILAKYYPGTALSATSGWMRVLISADTSDNVHVAGASGLKLQDLTGKRTVSLPTSVSGKSVTRWQIVRTSADKKRSKLQYRTTGDWKNFSYQGKALTWSGDGQFIGPSTITLILPKGSMKVRGALRSAKPSSGSGARDTVNVLSVDDYVRGVIPAEMPASWSAEALRSQAVAARTYGVRSRSASRYYDICSTTACQVYGGASRETAATDKAVAATAGQILTYKGAPAFTQFSSSSGGFTAKGSQPYLSAVNDPWDDWSGNKNHTWKISVKASTIESKYKSIGTLKKMTVTKRTGNGSFGGRVEQLRLEGSKKSVTITGNDARWAFGLRSNWFGF